MLFSDVIGVGMCTKPIQIISGTTHFILRSQIEILKILICILSILCAFFPIWLPLINIHEHTLPHIAILIDILFYRQYSSHVTTAVLAIT